MLQNEITDLAPDRGLKAAERSKLAEALGGAVADTFRITINLQGLHWNVEGPLFYSVHKLTEDQYRALTPVIDTLAERIRTLGMPAPQSLRELEQLSEVKDLPENVDLKARIERVIEDYEMAAERMKRIVAQGEKPSDIKTADLLTELVGQFEEFAWMFRATVATSEDEPPVTEPQSSPRPRIPQDHQNHSEKKTSWPMIQPV